MQFFFIQEFQLSHKKSITNLLCSVLSYLERIKWICIFLVSIDSHVLAMGKIRLMMLGMPLEDAWLIIVTLQLLT